MIQNTINNLAKHYVTRVCLISFRLKVDGDSQFLTTGTFTKANGKIT
jgi:hypothetical protein